MCIISSECKYSHESQKYFDEGLNAVCDPGISQFFQNDRGNVVFFLLMSVYLPNSYIHSHLLRSYLSQICSLS